MVRYLKVISLLVLFSVLFSPAFADSDSDARTSAVVTFSIDFPTSQPEHYSMRVPSDGAAHYQSSGHIAAASDTTDNFDLDFKMTTETRQRIFALTEKAGYFQKDLDSHNKNLAFTGKKTLTYGDAQRSGTCTYNYSRNSAVQELTNLMQSISATLEFGHRLQYDRHYQKLALDDELKHMEDMARGNELIEVTAIQPILDQIVADPSVINVTRARALHLLQASPHETSPTPR
jgi:hypothetical protein